MEILGSGRCFGKSLPLDTGPLIPVTLRTVAPSSGRPGVTADVGAAALARVDPTLPTARTRQALALRLTASAQRLDSRVSEGGDSPTLDLRHRDKGAPPSPEARDNIFLGEIQTFPARTLTFKAP